MKILGGQKSSALDMTHQDLIDYIHNLLKIFNLRCMITLLLVNNYAY
jgi:hypothetical protein